MPKEVIQPESPDFTPPEGLPVIDSLASAADTSLGSVIKKLADSLKPTTEFLDAVKSINASTEQFQVQLPKAPQLYEPDWKSLMPAENPQHRTNRLLAELIEKIDAQNKQSSKLIAPNFDTDTSSIIFANKPIPIKKDSNQAQLCTSLFKDPAKSWDWSEMVEDWGYTDWQKDDWRKVYEAARSVNAKVAIKTGVEDLVVYTKTTVALNPAYLGSS